ncbi:MAG TPA: MMPL family transporter, partial [Ilumatobacteraceae bacterium]
MRELWNKAGRLLSRRTVATLSVVAVVTVGLGFGLTRLDFATGQDSYIDPSSKVAENNKNYQNLFGGESMVVLFTMDEGKSIVDLFTPANIEKFQAVEQELLNDPSETVQGVVSPLTLLQWTQDLITKNVALQIIARTMEREPNADLVALRQKDFAITNARQAAAGAQDMNNPDWIKFLEFGNDNFELDAAGKLIVPSDDKLIVRHALRAFIPNNTHAILAGILVGNASLDQLATGSDVVQKAVSNKTFENATVTITGTPTFLTDINDYLQGGMLLLGAIAVVVMLVILLVAFKVRWRLLPLLGMLVGVVWGFGAFGFTGTKLSLVTIAGLPILIGLGIEFAIQIQNRIEEERSVERSRTPFEETLRHMGPPLLAATIAAVIAFLTVKISKVPMVQDFGVLLSIGIVALLVAGIVIPTTIIGARERRSPTTKEPVVSWVEKTVDKLGALPRMFVIPLVALAIAMPVLGLALEGGSKIESDPINWANQSSTSIKNARLLEHEVGFATTLGLFIETDSAKQNGVFTDQMGAFAFNIVGQAMDENKDPRSAVGKSLFADASSLATTVGWLAEVPGTTPLPPTGLDMLEAYNVAPAALQALLVADDGNATQVLFQVGPSSLEERSVVVDKLEAAIAAPKSGKLPAQASASTGGLAVVGVGLLENITANRAQLTIVALLLVGAFVVFRYRDLARGLLTMVPVLVATGTSAVLVRVLGITLSPLSTVGGPLVVATCAEFSVLLIARYAEERDRGLDPEASTHVAAQHTGRAFFTSALTTLGGFAVLMFSTLPLLADFGMVVTINIAVALLSALVIVPPLVKEADRRGWLALGSEPS